MTDTKLKEHITSEDFGIPADLADLAENYAQWRVQALSEQLAEAQALIEASRKQEPVAYKGKNYGNLHHHDFGNSIPLFSAPVVAPDVLKDAERYLWLRDEAFNGFIVENMSVYPRTGLNAAIDAAIKNELENKYGVV